MAAIDHITAQAADLTAWRRHLHAHPELGFGCHDTAAFVADRLRAFGADQVVEGLAETGVVAVIDGQGAGPVTGLRADMDALPIVEATGAPHASRHPGRMHACGHDGHTTMLLGAARYLCATRAFTGRAVLIFQPAEESGGGAGVMIDAGLTNRFGIEEYYALHTDPESDAGVFRTNPGAIMAATDDFEITVTGQGGHAAYPHLTRDPVPAALAIGQALQTLVSRDADPLKALVVSLTQINGGSATNITPDTVRLAGTVRCFDAALRDHAAARVEAIVAGQAASAGVSATLDYQRGYPATINHAPQARFAATIAEGLGAPVQTDAPPEMAAEDFAYMLAERPGAFLHLGQGRGPSLHNAGFDFNDAVAPLGASFFARLIETRHAKT